MIKANELRIGNIVYPFDDIDYLDFKKIINGFIYVSKDDFIDTSHLHVIPLTDEWLIRFGFELEEDFLYYLNGFYVLVKGNEFRFTPYGCLLDTNPDFESFNKVEFVHELQNIYYWNNNKTELELK